ncbi:MAG: hypothetical protein PHP23_09480 [Desulfobacterales bacterium]|nr:hypothetical protein [Desulfobacterales bacterium]MDD4071443.1 hypothetical protein [Desulfobacterales bacterium]MDD4392056.1 hypothetical protein [Desulfobacterales bacterium]
MSNKRIDRELDLDRTEVQKISTQLRKGMEIPIRLNYFKLR